MARLGEAGAARSRRGREDAAGTELARAELVRKMGKKEKNFQVSLLAYLEILCFTVLV
jgi:hypothetical protein